MAQRIKESIQLHIAYKRFTQPVRAQEGRKCRSATRTAMQRKLRSKRSSTWRNLKSKTVGRDEDGHIERWRAQFSNPRLGTSIFLYFSIHRPVGHSTPHLEQCADLPNQKFGKEALDSRPNRASRRLQVPPSASCRTHILSATCEIFCKTRWMLGQKISLHKFNKFQCILPQWSSIHPLCFIFSVSGYYSLILSLIRCIHFVTIILIIIMVSTGLISCNQ